MSDEVLNKNNKQAAIKFEGFGAPKDLALTGLRFKFPPADLVMF